MHCHTINFKNYSGNNPATGFCPRTREGKGRNGGERVIEKRGQDREGREWDGE